MLELEKKVNPLLKVDELQVNLAKRFGGHSVVSNLSLSIEQGEIVGIAGESGCGKSALSLAILQLLPKGMERSSGKVVFDERRIDELSLRKLQGIRGKEISMIFQDPMTALNPGLKIGTQLTETMSKHLNLSRREAQVRAAELLEKVGLPRASELLNQYPHELSGGMRQRVMIAIALSCQPKLIIADEPTTALDVTVQAQILQLLKKISREEKLAVLLISHDLGVLSQMCDRILIMYAGEIVEQGTADDVLHRTKHPYTRGLLSSMPTRDKKGKVLQTIEGTVPPLSERGSACAFYKRCPVSRPDCLQSRPMLQEGQGHAVRCFYPLAKER